MSLLARPVRPDCHVFGKEDFRTTIAVGSIRHNEGKNRVAVFRIDCNRDARRIPNRKPLCFAKHRGGGAHAEEECEFTGNLIRVHRRYGDPFRLSIT